LIGSKLPLVEAVEKPVFTIAVPPAPTFYSRRQSGRTRSELFYSLVSR